MKYIVPQAPDPAKEIETVVKQISRYQNGTKQVKEKLSRLKGARRKVSESLRVYELLAARSQHDSVEAAELLNNIKQRIKDFEIRLQAKSNEFKDNMFALEELKEGITKQTEEVWTKVTALQATCQEWKFSNQLNSDVCTNARTHAFGTFYRWALIQPLLRTWMATDSQIHRTTYATAQYEGVYEELMAHFEVKDCIEQFGEDHYAVYKDAPEDMVRTIRQATEERVVRTELLDQVHLLAARKLQKLVNSCKALQRDIEQREALRFKMNGLMMELSNALETDLRSALDSCENEATKPCSVTVSDLYRAIQDGSLAEAVAPSARDPFAAPDEDPIAAKKAARREGAIKGRAAAKPAHDPTDANTALNGVSKLPLLVQSEVRSSTGGIGAARGVSPSAAAGERNPAECDSPRGEETRKARASLHDSVYAGLPEYDASAIAYVQSFCAPKRSKTYRWCKHSAPEVNKSVHALYSVVRGPVELVVTEAEEAAEEAPVMADVKNSPKPTLTFQRRAGHSARHGIHVIMKNPSSPKDVFTRERESVGAAGMPAAEWLKKASRGESEESSQGAGAGPKPKPTSPTESAEDQRKRVLKFMLNSRETHYDLMDREVVDAVTVLQMEQARAAAAARRERELDTARPKSADEAQALDTHQYRTHQLLTDDYTGHQSEPGQSAVREEYSLYVSLPEMSALTAVTTREAIRAMQGVSAAITHETISKMSEILSDATSTAVVSRAGTADVPHRAGYGQQGTHQLAPPSHMQAQQQQQQQQQQQLRPSPPHSPAHSGRMPLRQFSNSHTLASTTSSRGRMATLEDTLEAQTASVLDSIPIETQAQDLNEKVATDFRRGREKVEDWLETHAQCNYKATKRALVELVSNLQLGLSAAADKDDELHNSLSDRDDSSVEGAGPGQPGPSAREAAPSKPASSEPVMTLEHMLEMSKNLIGSIKENLREFTEKNHNSMIPDDITHHRRPNSASNLSSQARMQAMQMRASSGEDAFFEDDDDAAYDPNDYAFTRSRPTTAPRSPGGESGSEDGGAPTSASPTHNPRLTALLSQQRSQLTGSANWPTKRTLLNSMESIICGDLFVVDFFWVPQNTTTELIAKYYVSKTQYHECRFTVTPHMISDLTKTPRDLALHTLFHDPAKVAQAIISSLTNETIDTQFYTEIVKAYKQKPSAGGDFEPHWSLLTIEEMLHPKNIVTRRGRISSLYRPSSSEKSGPSTPEMRASKHIAQALEESGMVGKREFDFLMHILTVRKKSGELLAYSFFSPHEIIPAEPLLVAVPPAIT